jgi:hypothetical protein
LGIASLEDKIVQQAVVWVLQAIYEQDFVGFSYGFRPGRSQHDALDALSVAITSKRVNWILDADIEGFFDTIDHDWLLKFLEHRIGDPRLLRLIRKWLTAGVSEDGKWSKTNVGTPQGAVITPPTKEQTFAIILLVEKKGEVDSVGNSDLIGFDLNTINSRSKDFPACVPVGFVEAACNL